MIFYYILYGLWTFFLFVTIFSAFNLWLKFNVAWEPPQRRRRPITILKPLRGYDENLGRCLESFFKQSFIKGDELIFCVESSTEFGLSLVRNLMNKYPSVPARVVCNPDFSIPNPKIANIYKSYLAANNDLILISDSNALVAPDYLNLMDTEFVGGVLTMPSTGANSKSFAGDLECMYLSTFYARFLTLGNRVGHPFVVGKSMMFSRTTAEKFGFLRTGEYLAEDYMTGQFMKGLGEKVKFAYRPIVQHIGKYPLSEFWWRHIRWGRMRKAHAPYMFAVEAIYGLVPTGVMGYVAASHLGYDLQTFLIAHFSVWIMADAIALKTCNNRLNIRALTVWLSREAIAPVLWIHTAIGCSINWRGHSLELLRKGLLPLTNFHAVTPPDMSAERVTSAGITTGGSFASRGPQTS